VLPVGGVKQKVLAAHRHGLKKVILPRANEVDLDDVPQEVRDELTFVLVEHLDEGLETAMTPKAEFEELVEAEETAGGNGHSRVVATLLS